MNKSVNPILSIIAVVMLLIIATTFIVAPLASAESQPRIDNVVCDDTGISGHIYNAAEAKAYYIRVTLLLNDSIYIILEAPVLEDGTWEISAQYRADYIIVQLVDRPYTFISGQFVIYDMMGIPVFD